MNPVNYSAIDPLEILRLEERKTLERMEELDAKLEGIRGAIQQLEGLGTRSDVPYVSRNEFSGLKLIDAVIRYLHIKRQSGRGEAAKVREEVCLSYLRVALKSPVARIWDRNSESSERPLAGTRPPCNMTRRRTR
jgi:hypothetical protein